MNNKKPSLKHHKIATERAWKKITFSKHLWRNKTHASESQPQRTSLTHSTAQKLTWSCAPTNASSASSNRSTMAHLAGVPRASRRTGSTSEMLLEAGGAAAGGDVQPLPESAPGDEIGNDLGSRGAITLIC
jgi:hypothetical protein